MDLDELERRYSDSGWWPEIHAALHRETVLALIARVRELEAGLQLLRDNWPSTTGRSEL